MYLAVGMENGFLVIYDVDPNFSNKKKDKIVF